MTLRGGQGRSPRSCLSAPAVPPWAAGGGFRRAAPARCTQLAMRFLLGGECLPRHAPDVLRGWLEAFLLTLPASWVAQFQVVTNTQNHDGPSESVLLKQAVWDADPPCVVQRHTRRLGEDQPLEVLHGGVANQRPTQGCRELAEGLLWPEPEATVRARGRNEAVSVDLGVQHVSQLRRNGEALFLVKRVLVFAEKQHGGTVSCGTGAHSNPLCPTTQHPTPFHSSLFSGDPPNRPVSSFVSPFRAESCGSPENTRHFSGRLVLGP